MGIFKKQKTDLNKNIFEGSSIQQALTNAAEALKVSPEQISYDVISYGSTGVFGLVGNKRAKIRVRSSMRVKEKALSATEKYWREIQEEQEKFASKELSREKQNGKTFEENKPETVKVKNQRKVQNNRKQRFEKDKNAAEKPVEAVTFTKQETKDEVKEKTPRRGRQRNNKRAPKYNDNNVSDIPSDEISALPEMNIATEPLSGQLAQAYDVMQSLAQSLLDTPFQIMYTLTEKKIAFIFKGENLSALIGKNGNTRRSLQLVADRIINKGGQGKYDVNVIVDTLRQNRSKRLLTSLARKKADQCRKTGEEISLGLMNAYERCIIHIALKKDPYVETKSVGDGAKKEIFVVPADKNKPAAEISDNKDVKITGNTVQAGF